MYAKQSNAAAPNDLQITIFKNGTSQGTFTVNNSGGLLATLTPSNGDTIAFAYGPSSVNVGYNRNINSIPTTDYPTVGTTCLGGVGGTGEYTFPGADRWMWYTFDGNYEC